jgi:type III secretion system YscQ/HrcQ family protein
MKPKTIPLARVLPQVDRWAVRLLRCAGAARRRGAVASGWPEFGFGRMSPLPVTANALTARITTRSGSALLAIEPRDWPALASAATLADVARRNAVAQVLFGERLGAFAWHVGHIELEAGGAAGRTSGGLVMSLASMPLAVLAVDDSLLDAIESWTDFPGGEQPESFLSAAGAMRLPSRIVLASRLLPQARLQNLRVGDALLLPPGSAPAPILGASLSWGDDPIRPGQGLQASVLLAQATMTLTTPPAFQTDDLPHAPAEYRNGDAALDRLAFPVTFELAGPLMRLAEISRLAAGDVLELKVPVEHAELQIRIAGQAWGLGELVAVGGRLGVRILRMDPLADAIERAAAAEANAHQDAEPEMAA